MIRADRFGRLLLAGVAATAIAVPAWAQQTDPAPGAEVPTEEGTLPASAETQDESAEAADNEIIVTARRRSEVLQDVPIAVTAYSAEQLDRQGALDITEVGDTTPNVTLETSRGTNTTLTAFIRGVGQQDPVAGFEQGVGLYIDDVYLNRPQAALLDIYDVERIEILRGPQGTLYGRNTIGGAVKYVTRRLADIPQGSVRANIGSYKQFDLIMSASTPLAEGLRIGGAIARLSRDGFGDNLTTGEENYNKEIIAARGTVELEPSDRVFFRLTGDWTWDDSATRGGHRLIPSFLTNAPVLDNEFDTRGGLDDPKQKVRSGGVSLHGEIGLTDALKIRSISAWRKDDSGTPIDFDALPAVDLDVPAIYNNKQLSQEFQLVYEQGPLSGILGAYYLDAEAFTAFDVRLFTTAAGFATHTSAQIDTKTSAIFADFSYDLTDQISVSAGGRYTWDKRIADIFRIFYLGGGAPMFGGAGIPFGAPQTDFEGSRKFNKFTPRASVSFKPDRNHNLYASYAQGFKGGSFDPRGTAVNAPDLDGDGTVSQEEIADFISFEPETVDSYELGYKGSPLGGLDLAVALFRANYKDVQIPGSEPCVVGGVATFCGVTNNAAKARFNGVEVEANARIGSDLFGIGDRLNLAGSLGYLDARYTQFVTNIPGQGPTDVTDFRKVQNTPKWTASGTLDYSTPAAGGRLNFNTTVSYRSKIFQFEIPDEFFDQPGFALVDANLLWRAPDNRYFIGLHGKNLTDKRYITSGYNFLSRNPMTGVPLRGPNGELISGTGREGTVTAFYGNPRQVFVSLGMNF